MNNYWCKSKHKKDKSLKHWSPSIIELSIYIYFDFESISIIRLTERPKYIQSYKQTAHQCVNSNKTQWSYHAIDSSIVFDRPSKLVKSNDISFTHEQAWFEDAFFVLKIFIGQKVSIGLMIFICINGFNCLKTSRNLQIY